MPRLALTQIARTRVAHAGHGDICVPFSHVADLPGHLAAFPPCLRARVVNDESFAQHGLQDKPYVNTDFAAATRHGPPVDRHTMLAAPSVSFLAVAEDPHPVELHLNMAARPDAGHESFGAVTTPPVQTERHTTHLEMEHRLVPSRCPLHHASVTNSWIRSNG